MNPIITISPEIQSGTPVFTGTRVPIKNYFDYIKAGDSLNDFLDDFPSVKKEQTIALIEMIEQFFLFQELNHERITAGRKFT